MRMADAGRVTLDLLHLIRDAKLRAEIMLILLMYVYVISTINSILESSSLYGLSKNFVWFMIKTKLVCWITFVYGQTLSCRKSLSYLCLLQTPSDI